MPTVRNHHGPHLAFLRLLRVPGPSHRRLYTCAPHRVARTGDRETHRPNFTLAGGPLQLAPPSLLRRPGRTIHQLPAPQILNHLAPRKLPMCPSLVVVGPRSAHPSSRHLQQHPRRRRTTLRLMGNFSRGCAMSSPSTHAWTTTMRCLGIFVNRLRLEPCLKVFDPTHVLFLSMVFIPVPYCHSR